MLLLELIAFGLIGTGTLLKGITMVSKLSKRTQDYKQQKKLEDKKKKEEK